jgi:hypothetical protein
MYADPQSALDISRERTAHLLAEAANDRLARVARGSAPGWWRRAQRARRGRRSGPAARLPDAAPGVASSMS